MLNRRILRFKTFHALYSYHKVRDANQLWAAERMKIVFEPNWLALDPPNLKALEAEYEQAREIFYQIVRQDPDRPEAPQAPASRRAAQAIQTALHFYREQTQKDRLHIRQQMTAEAEGLYQTYLLIWQLLIELAQDAYNEAQARRNRAYSPEPIYENEYKLYHNQWLAKLQQDDHFQTLQQSHRLQWDAQTIRTWYRRLEEQDWYQTYQALPQASFADDYAILDQIIREFIFRDEVVLVFFEERELQWEQNQSILRNMLLRTLKNTPTQDDPILLQPLAKSWEEDKDFFEDLFDQTLAHQAENTQRIAERLNNWELERIALTDRIILQMALTELLHFQSIPIKVSINEYVEMTKKYSPPKSKEFVNGLLDRLAQAFAEEGKIKKSGRGLLDNK